MKSKLAVCLQKGDNDDKLIQALQQKLKQSQNNREKKQDLVFENLKKICSEQEAQIQQLLLASPEQSTTPQEATHQPASQDTNQSLNETAGHETSKSIEQVANKYQKVVHSLKQELKLLTDQKEYFQQEYEQSQLELLQLSKFFSCRRATQANQTCRQETKIH